MNIKENLQRLGKFANKRFGQNFLINETVIKDITQLAKLDKSQTVVEIGSGLGALTLPLAKLSKRVVAIESDRDLAHFLREKKIKNLDVVTGDALKVDWTATIEDGYVIVANLPYSITSPIIRKIFSLEKKPAFSLLMVQEEVAQRLTAPAGSSERGFLTVLTEANAECSIMMKVGSGNFYPQPKIDSALIKLIPKKSEASLIFWPYVEAGFRHKRQTFVNAISRDLSIDKQVIHQALKRLKIDKMVRAEDLSIEQWQELSKALKNI